MTAVIDPPQTITVQEFADAMDISKNVINWRRVKAGTKPIRIVGRCHLYFFADLARLFPEIASKVSAE